MEQNRKHDNFISLLTCAPSEKKWEVLAQFWEAVRRPLPIFLLIINKLVQNREKEKNCAVA
jgi:hypothetical protein